MTACSTIRIPGTKKKNPLNKGDYTEMSSRDFADHLSALKEPFLASSGIEIVKNQLAKNYIEGLAAEIISKNETFFKNLKGASVTILKSESPLYFSLPKGEIFISNGLISKYIKHESMLVSILSYELVRSENLLYPQTVVIPTGNLPLERMLMFGRLTLDEKVEVHKWAYYLTVRSGYDGEYYLSWLQTQNRNTADFLFLVGDASLINREESLFKAHLIKTSADEETSGKKNSSKTFYSFINSIRDQRS